MKKVYVAIIGCGTVGGGTLDILTENREVIMRKSGAEFEVKKILDKYPEKLAGKVSADKLASSLDEILADPEISVVVETMGGVEPAKTFILKCFAAGKNVVSANKELIAKHWGELEAAAKANGVGFYFEASCVGGVPVIRTLTESLQGDNITSIAGIFNGTTNFILSKMTDEGSDYAEVLKEAQKLGFAEANPTADVEGYDAAYKLSVLSSLAFGEYVPYTAIDRKGITGVTSADIAAARAGGYVIKLIASGVKTADGLDVSVAPTFVPVSDPLSGISGSFNAFRLHGDMVDDVMLTGRGAGARPTGSAIVSDVVYCAQCTEPEYPPFAIGSADDKIRTVRAKKKYFFSVSGADVTAVEKAIGDLKTESVVLDLNSGRVEIFTAPVGKSDLIAAIDEVKKAVAGASVGEVFGILE